MSRIHSEQIRKVVEKERIRGKTYRELTRLFGIPKSTLSYWFGEKLGNPFDREGQLKHLAKIRPLAIAAKKNNIIQQQNDLREKIRDEIATYPLNNIGLQKVFLSGLYWAEGAKHEKVSGLKFANTDPKLCLLYLSLLRRCYLIDESRMRIRLHLHYYHSRREVKKFWSDLLNVSESLFGKVYEKKRSKTKKFRKNFMGICFITYLDSNIRKELMELAGQFYENIVSKRPRSSTG